MIRRLFTFIPCFALALTIAACSSTEDTAGERPYEGRYHGSGQHSTAAKDDRVSGVGYRNQRGHLGDNYGRRSAAAEPKQPKKPEPVAEARPAGVKAEPLRPVRQEGNWASASLAIPTGNRETSALLIEKMAPVEVRVGAPYEYRIKVTNISRNQLDNVTVRDALKGAFDLRTSDPKVASSTGGVATWTLGSLNPGEERIIRVTGAARSSGRVIGCAQAEYDTGICLETVAVEPKLKLQKVCPNALLACEEGTIRYTVSNGGTGAARNVVIRDPLPNGWKTSTGANDVAINVGTLASGQTRSFDVKVRPAGKGRMQSTATASAAGGLNSSASCDTIVRQPALAITKTGPSKRFVGKNVTYEITVRNTGDGEARNTMLEDVLPAGTSFVSASAGGSHRGGRVSWNLGTLTPNASKKVSVTIKATRKGTIRNTATAKAYCASPTSANASTSIDGIPAILLEVIDVEDPIEVGSNVTYVITVTNQGSAPGTGIKIDCALENATMGFVSATGDTALSGSGGATFSFKPLASLAPKAKATWRVTVKAKKAGDVRFKLNMRSDQIGRPVTETEATNFYE